jgi:lipopolysaccharide transport system permease protein
MQSETTEKRLMRILLGPFSALWRYGSLTRELAKRDVLGRYRGASFGLLWSLISPFLMLCIYSFAFGVVMKAKWPHMNNGDHHFAIILFIGLIVHGFFAECLNRAPTLVTGNTSFVKRVVFPLEILPWPTVISALFHAAMNLLVYVALRYLLEHSGDWTILLLPAVFVPLIFISLGICWLFAALGVYLRDISQVTGLLATAMLFLSSAMIPVQSLPESYRGFFYLNPLTFLIDQARAVALWGQLPDWQGLALYTLGGLILMYISYAWFMVTKRGFADVL